MSASRTQRDTKTGDDEPEPWKGHVRSAELHPIRHVTRELTRPDGTKLVVKVPVYPPFKLRDHSAKPQQRGHSAKPQQRDHSAKPQQRDHSAKPQQRGHSAKPQQRGHSAKPQQRGHKRTPKKKAS